MSPKLKFIVIVIVVVTNTVIRTEKEENWAIEEDYGMIGMYLRLSLDLIFSVSLLPYYRDIFIFLTYVINN